MVSGRGFRAARSLVFGLTLGFFLTTGIVGSAAENGLVADPHAVGCILPLSGRYATLGSRALDAVLLATGVFQGEKETPIRLIVEDSQSEPAVAGAAVARLHEKGVVCIIGPLGGLEVMEAAKEAQRLKIPILTLTQWEGITEIGDYVFRNFLTAAMQVRTIVHYAQAELGLRRFAILYPEDSYGQEMARLFRQEVLRNGGEIRRVQSYRTDENDYAGPICALAGIVPAGDDQGKPPGVQVKPDPGFEALFIPDAYLRVAMIVPQLAYHDVTGIRLLGTSGWDSPELLKTDPELFEGAVFVDGFFSDSFRSEASNFTEAFYLAYGREPETMEALVYDAARMAVQLIIEERGQDPESFRNALAQVKDFPGVTGRTSFPPSRDAQKELFVLTVRDNQIIQVK